MFDWGLLTCSEAAHASSKACSRSQQQVQALALHAQLSSMLTSTEVDIMHQLCALEMHSCLAWQTK